MAIYIISTYTKLGPSGELVRVIGGDVRFIIEVSEETYQEYATSLDPSNLSVLSFAKLSLDDLSSEDSEVTFDTTD